MFNPKNVFKVVIFLKISIAENKPVNFFRLVELGRNLNKADVEPLKMCAIYLKELQQYSYAAEMYLKMGDQKALVSLYVEAHQWEEVP